MEDKNNIDSFCSQSNQKNVIYKKNIIIVLVIIFCIIVGGFIFYIISPFSKTGLEEVTNKKNENIINKERILMYDEYTGEEVEFKLLNSLEEKALLIQKPDLYNQYIQNKAVTLSDQEICKGVRSYELTGATSEGDVTYEYEAGDLWGDCINNYAVVKGKYELCQDRETVSAYAPRTNAGCMLAAQKNSGELLTEDFCELIAHAPQYGHCLGEVFRQSDVDVTLEVCLDINEISDAFPDCVLGLIKKTGDISLCEAPEIKKRWSGGGFSCAYQGSKLINKVTEGLCLEQKYEYQIDQCLEYIVETTGDTGLCDRNYEKGTRKYYGCVDPLMRIGPMASDVKIIVQ